MFTDFTEQLRSRFAKIDERFNSLDSVSRSSFPVSQGTIDVNQDVTNLSFATPTSVDMLTMHVAMLARHAPSKIAYVP